MPFTPLDRSKGEEEMKAVEHEHEQEHEHERRMGDLPVSVKAGGQGGTEERTEAWG